VIREYRSIGEATAVAMQRNIDLAVDRWWEQCGMTAGPFLGAQHTCRCNATRPHAEHGCECGATWGDSGG